ncbi:MAG: hypothetical protein H0V73_10880, partial [Chloroflexi bacterium]|nr:hypothetical protein [Chloroflexota bacterium]
MPDGRHLLVLRFDPALDEETPWLVGADGTGWVSLPIGGSIDLNASPDGQRISFKGANGALFVQGIDGTGLVRVSPDVDVAFKSDWAPDGGRLAFSDYSHPEPGQPVNVWT